MNFATVHAASPRAALVRLNQNNIQAGLFLFQKQRRPQACEAAANNRDICRNGAVQRLECGCFVVLHCLLKPP